MKKLLLLTALICVAFCTSCQKEVTSLDGTTWVDNNGNWGEHKLSFTSTYATYTFTLPDGSSNGKNFTGTYTFDPPTVTITTTMPGENGVPVTPEMTGTVKKRTMNIGIHETADLIVMLELKMQ